MKIKINHLRALNAVGYLMLKIYNPFADEVRRLIDPSDLAPDGFEYEPHVTLLMDVPSTQCPEDLLTFAMNHIVVDDELYLGNISVFENEEYDVLKWDVSEASKDRWMTIFHDNLIQEFHIEEHYPEFHPHSTIAYLIKGKGKEYAEKLKDYHDIKVNMLKLDYSIQTELR